MSLLGQETKRREASVESTTRRYTMISSFNLTPQAARSLASELSEISEGLRTVTLEWRDRQKAAFETVLVTLDAGWGKKRFWVDQDGSVVPAGVIWTPRPPWRPTGTDEPGRTPAETP